MNFSHLNKALRITSVLFLLVFSSCSKRGCMDSDADTYEPKAKIDCHCCTYEAKGLGWYNQVFYNTMKSRSVTALNYYVNSELAGQTNYISYYSSSAPTLATNNSDYSFYRKETWNVLFANLGSDKMKKMQVRVTDQNGTWLMVDSVIFKANRVVTFELR